jgi:predicted nucleic acid-binding protein
MKVFLDTNVWLSATVFAGLCEDIVVQCAERGWLVSSLLVQEEAHEVLRRKFASQPQACDLFDAAWRSATLVADVAGPVGDNDLRLVNAVAQADIAFFVTGDKRVLGWAQSAPAGCSLGKLRIVSPREAWVALFGDVGSH